MGCGIAQLGASPCSPAHGWMALHGLSVAQMPSHGACATVLQSILKT